MKLTEIYVDGFGTWHGLRLRKLSSDITVFYGPNEAGKTTLMHFLRSMLYGVTAERRERYLPPREGGRPGGFLGISSDDGPFEAARYAERDGDDRGRVVVTLPDGEEQGDRLLREALESVDEKTFSNVFAIGLDEINELGALEGAEASRWIYRLTSGLDRVSLYDVIQGLRQSRTKLLAPAGERSTITDLIAQRERLTTDIGELSVQNRVWSRLMIDLDDSSAQISQLEEELKEAERRARRFEIALGLKPLWSDRVRVDNEMLRYVDLTKLPESAIEKLDSLNTSSEEQQKRIAGIRGQRRQLRDEINELSVNEVLVRSCCRLDALGEQQDWLSALERQSAELTEETEKLESRIESEEARLAKLWRHKPSPEAAPELDDSTIDLLQPAAETVASAEAMVSEAQGEVDSRRSNERQYVAQMESAYASGDKLGLPIDIEEAGDLVAQLRRRLKAEQKIEQNRRQFEDLERQETHLVDRQVMPMELFLLLISIFSLCGVVAAWPFVMDTAPTLWTLGGFFGIIGVFMARYLIDENAADQLDECQEQIDLAQQQIDDALKDTVKLDADLPLKEGSVVLRLQNAERHLEELEKMLPVETERRRAKQKATSAEEFLLTAKSDLETAEKEWRVALRSVGLPDETTPNEIEKLALQYASLNELRGKAETKQEVLEQCDQEYERVVRRITAIAEESELVLEEGEPLEQLEHLLTERRLQQGRTEHRKKLREKARELKEKYLGAEKVAERIDSDRESLFRAAMVDGEQGYRQLASDWETVVKLEEKHERLTREIAAAIGTSGTEEDYENLLAADKIGRLEGEWDSLTSDRDQTDKRLRELVVHRSTLEERRKAMIEDTSLADKQIELDMVEAQLAQAKRQWRVRASVGSMLELIRNDYEEHRQPETLIEASKYLSRLTRGRYPRIWTPLGDDVLMVDDEDGVTMPVENLSRGAREQLFLSIRMALVALFARRGVQLPMILDDVLVNFDDGRAKIAAQVLTEFAKDGHQMFVFTCHEHVWEMFKGLQTDVRRLPVRYEIEEEPVEEESVEEIIEEVVIAEVPEPIVEEVIEEIVEEIIEEEPEIPSFVEAEYAPIEQRVTTKTITQTVEAETDDVQYEERSSKRTIIGSETELIAEASTLYGTAVETQYESTSYGESAAEQSYGNLERPLNYEGSSYGGSSYEVTNLSSDSRGEASRRPTAQDAYEANYGSEAINKSLYELPIEEDDLPTASQEGSQAIKPSESSLWLDEANSAWQENASEELAEQETVYGVSRERK